MLLAKIVAILCADLQITANSVTEITQSDGGA
ncbi:sugar ABC transporter [Klebsiella pneumoniae]|nr:sugar ABC transporter [Klebsiella pneumoniae]